MNTSLAMKEFAKKRLHENFWPMVLATLIISVLTGIASANSGYKININYVPIYDGSQQMNVEQSFNPFASAIMLAISFLVVNPLQVGVCHFFRMNIYQNARIEDIRRALDGYWDNVITMGLKNIIISVGFALCVVPGVILGLGFALVPYIQAENPKLGVTEALTLSWNKMKGHKGELFMLYLSFIGWILLTVLTCGLLGIFHVNPYLQQTIASFADTLLSNQHTAPFARNDGRTQNIEM